MKVPAKSGCANSTSGCAARRREASSTDSGSESSSGLAESTPYRDNGPGTSPSAAEASSPARALALTPSFSRNSTVPVGQTRASP